MRVGAADSFNCVPTVRLAAHAAVVGMMTRPVRIVIGD